jgi:hypothetical protein
MSQNEKSLDLNQLQDHPLISSTVNLDTLRKQKWREKKKLVDAGLFEEDFLTKAKKQLDMGQGMDIKELLFQNEFKDKLTETNVK